MYFEQEWGKAIVQRIAIVQIINTTKCQPKFPGILAACILPPPEVTSHTLFKDGVVMEKLIAQLRQYVADHPPDYGDGDCHSILDMLYYRYSMLIQCGFRNRQTLFCQADTTMRIHDHIAVFHQPFEIHGGWQIVRYCVSPPIRNPPGRR